MALVPPFFLDCVTAIGFPEDDSRIDFSATGFLYGRFAKPATAERPSMYNVCLLTNRHVFEGERLAILRFNPAAGTPAKLYTLPLIDNAGKQLWYVPQDDSIDVAAVPIDVQKLNSEGMQLAFFHSDQHVLDTAGAREQGLTEGDGVFVLGFPLGDTGGERNYVVVREGVVARIRDTLAGSTQTFLIDASVFPGNSGGPVVTRPEAMAISGTKPYAKASLIGMVSGYVPYNDIAYSRQTNRRRVIFEENTGLAIVVPVDRIIEVVESVFGQETAMHQPQSQP